MDADCSQNPMHLQPLHTLFSINPSTGAGAGLHDCPSFNALRPTPLASHRIAKTPQAGLKLKLHTQPKEMEVSPPPCPLPPQQPQPFTPSSHPPTLTLQKFTKWADKGTSVNPFLPPREASKPLPAKALGWLGGLLLVALRLPFLLVALTWLALAALLAHPLTNLASGIGTCIHNT